MLQKGKDVIPTFAEYAAGWWNPETCKYLQKKLARKTLSVDYERCSRVMTERFLIPAFGRTRLDKITSEQIDEWLTGFTRQVMYRDSMKIAKKPLLDESGEPRRYKPSTANLVFGVLRLMLNEATKRGIKKYNPALNVEKLAAPDKEIEILTMDEVKLLFAPKPKALPAPGKQETEKPKPVSFGKKAMAFEMAHMANLLAACSGMRIGEVLGLRGEFVYADFIRVDGQYGRHGYGPTKTRTD